MKPNHPDIDKRLSAYEMEAAPSEVDSDVIADTKLYETLLEVFKDCYNRAANGKGKERHAEINEPFERQPICRIIYTFGEHAWDGQIAKKMIEADRLNPEAGDRELIDCINYLAGRIVARRKSRRI